MKSLTHNRHIYQRKMNNKVYIVAKISGLPEAVVKAKYDRAKEVVRSHGYEPVSPIDYISPTTDWHTAMRICIPLMLQCGAYTIVDPVHTTPGGLIEDTIGQWVNLPKLYFSKL